MTGKTAAETGETRDPRPKRGAKRPDADGLVEGLERLRDSLSQRLDQIEALAVEQAALLGQDSTDRERTLRDRVSSLEASQARLQAEVKRREQEWLAVGQQLEADRSLLAESWERLEQERIDSPGEVGRARPAAAGRAPAAGSATPDYRPSGADESDDPVTRAVLRQFQTMKGDVRRNAKGRTGR